MKEVFGYMNNIIDYKKIGLRIQKARKEKGYTQGKICDALNISIYHYSKIENAKVSASLDTLAEIAAFLDLDLESLLTGSSKINKQYLNDEMADIFERCTITQKKMILEFAKYISKSDIKSVPTKIM